MSRTPVHSHGRKGSKLAQSKRLRTRARAFETSQANTKSGDAKFCSVACQQRAREEGGRRGSSDEAMSREAQRPTLAVASFSPKETALVLYFTPDSRLLRRYISRSALLTWPKAIGAAPAPPEGDGFVAVVDAAGFFAWWWVFAANAADVERLRIATLTRILFMLELLWTGYKFPHIHP